MSVERDFDPDLARELDETLAPYTPIERIATARPRSSRGRRMTTALVAATIAASLLGLGYQINASAESQGLGCLHPVAKVQLYAADVAASLDHGGRTHDQQHDQRASHEACH